MTPSVRRVADPILQALDGRVRVAVLRRFDAMERELSFLSERNDERVRLIRQRGWTDERLHLLFVLNSVYQQVLGPLEAAAKGGPEGLGTAIPVRHGASSFDRKSENRVQAATRDFRGLVDALQVQRGWLHSNTCGDLVFSIWSSERAKEQT
jgi:hypothetical protein